MEKQIHAVVVGGAGFIGGHLVDALITRGWTVDVIDDLSGGKEEQVNKSATLHVLDMRNYDDIAPVIKGKDYVFLLAALPRVQFSIDNPQLTNEVNIGGTLNVLHAAKEGKVKKVVFSSSGAVYGDQDVLPVHEGMMLKPVSPYALQKQTGEEYARIYADIHGLGTVSLRYFNVYGSRMNFDGGAYTLALAAFLKQKKLGKPFQITGDGTQTRDFTHVRDVVRANILAAESETVQQGERVNIGAGHNISINALAEMVGGPIEYIEARKENLHSRADNRLAKELLGWEPSVRIEDGVQEILKEYGFLT